MRKQVDLCCMNGKVLNVFNRKFEEKVLWIDQGKIVATGEKAELTAHEVFDAQGAYIVPGMIDAHVHIESSMVAPSELGKALLTKGTTTIVTDPHEIANVTGISGLKYMINDAGQTPLDIFFMLPSSVPCTPFEHNGATLTAEDLRPLYAEPSVKGLAEVMDYPAVAKREPDIMQKIQDAQQLGYHADGHGAGLDASQLDVYRQVGIDTDHECTTIQQAKERLSAGFWTFLREGSVEKDLEKLIPVVTESNAQRFAFCTDDKLISDLLIDGGINYCIQLAIKNGIRPETAYTMASYNAAQAHKLTDRGILNTGFVADLVVLKDLKTATAQKVMKNGQWIVPKPTRPLSFTTNTVHQHLEKTDLKIKLTDDYCNVIGIIPNHIETNHLQKHVPLKNGYFVNDTAQDISKMIVVERHHQLGTFGLGLVHGFKITNGAIATTIAHDSHNIVAVGSDDQAIYTAIQAISSTHGGIAVSKGTEVLAKMPLPIAGLMSNQSCQVAAEQLTAILNAYLQISLPSAVKFNPFITLSFLTLPVIPSIKLTDQGLYDFEQANFISLEIK